jgi:uncharacterized protein with HEPN domain
MSRSEMLFLLDVEEACQKILRYTQGMDFETFVGAEMAYDAVLRNLEIIGEAVKGVSQELRNRYPELDWRGMAGLRDVLAQRILRAGRSDLVEHCGERYSPGPATASTHPGGEPGGRLGSTTDSTRLTQPSPHLLAQR